MRGLIETNAGAIKGLDAGPPRNPRSMMSHFAIVNLKHERKAPSRMERRLSTAALNGAIRCRIGTACVARAGHHPLQH